MITSLKLENFKGFDQFELTNITPIVLLSGRNNSGKTTILESLFLFLDHSNADSFIKLSNFRGISPQITNSLWESLFFQLNINRPITIAVTDNGIDTTLSYCADRNYIPSDASVPTNVLSKFVSSAKTNYSLKYTVEQPNYAEIGHFTISDSSIMCNKSVQNMKPFIEMSHGQFINSIISNSDIALNDWIGKLEISGDIEKVVDILKIIEPKITDVRSISISGQPTLYARIAGKMLPLKLCGDGINRLLYIVACIMENPASVILIDEIETGFHYSLYPKIWEIIAKVSKDNNCQVLVSTHSIECIYGAVEGVNKAGSALDFTYYRLDRKNGHTTAKRFDYDMLSYAVNSNMEVR